MKIVFHEDFFKTYSFDPAASKGRLDHAAALLTNHYPVVTPYLASEKQIKIIHTDSHVQEIQNSSQIYHMARLAAGSAIKAADLAYSGTAAFSLARPPGHHAGPSTYWGFCYFNNIAIAVKQLILEEKINSAVIVDFDLHLGDGTIDSFADTPEVHYYHLENGIDLIGLNNGNKDFRNHPVTQLREYLKKFYNIPEDTPDILAVSAGFDRHIHDWGGSLDTKEYQEIGEELGKFAKEQCQGKIFSVLEGGYNPESLGESALAFCQGIEKGVN
ncbi:histone deacetylase family protein [Natranaerobius thermophilus]|uniref:Histone deacetylase superfamily n=1 Tax=Natranaerobius thermophilus (strain ATCC BAA-1301 / DSM 18059 / JW/NM-WN-LF) TaxID=457570 RepID=B2A0L7_NATTJ|nr:histone deacetylase family protein [Natranaerobius thermophilus]ACB84578.1 histone deacetylase superfamily [Natranaerobius thermophilus JW/NM-WN-LF]